MNNVAAILGSQFLIKILGLVYNLVIINIPGFGDIGNGYRTAGFQFYTMLLAISSVGIPCLDGLGTSGGKIHSPDEFGFLESLKASAKRLAAIAYSL